MTKAAQLRCSFIAANVVALGAGTQYMYSFYAPELLQRCHIPSNESGSLSLAISVGSGGFACLAGFITDTFGPRVGCAVGAVCTFLAYSYLHYCLWMVYNNIPLLMVAFALLGFGCVTSLQSAVKCNTVNFPTNRGAAVGCTFAVFALSALSFSVISYLLFGENLLSVLAFLSAVCPALMLIGGSLLIMQPDEEDDDNAPATDDEALRPTGSRDVNSVFEKHSTDISVNSFNSEGVHPIHKLGRSSPGCIATEFTSLLGRENLGLRTIGATGLAVPTIHIDETTAAAALTNNLPSDKPWIRKMLDIVTESDFILYYVMLAIVLGAGQMYIYSVGYIVDILLVSYPKHVYDGEEVKAMQVSIFSAMSCLGRLLSGFLSDVLLRRYRVQRLWMIFTATVLVLLGAIQIVLKPTQGVPEEAASAILGASLSTFLFGLGFGMTFGTFPAIVAETFGTTLFSTVWGILTTGGLVTLDYFSRVFSTTLDLHSPNNGMCEDGSSCYAYAFHIIQIFAGFGGVLALCTILLHYKTSRKSNREHTDIHIN